MVRPASFGWNPETQASNRFQRADAALSGEANRRARLECDGVGRVLREAGVAVHVAEDLAHPACPDAVFPNNWLSLHHDGTVVLYPMLAPNRRRERRLELVSELASSRHLAVRRLLDLTHYESDGVFLEGTGSVVFDHVRRVAYACLSPRTHWTPLEELCAELGYRACTFAATDAQGIAIYHTNVMLAIGTRCAVVAGEAIAADDRERVLDQLRASGRQVETIDRVQMQGFAGNVLELCAADGAAVLALSQRAAQSFGEPAMARLGRCVDRLAVAEIPAIETLGGGSVRCMLAEVFLPA
jgi:hypothetical protein